MAHSNKYNLRRFSKRTRNKGVGKVYRRSSKFWDEGAVRIQKERDV